MAQFPGVYHSPYDNTIAALIARQGDIAGESAARSGAIWGRAIENVGQIAGAEVERRQGEKTQQEREARFDAALQSWDGKDPMALYRAIAPGIGSKDAMTFVNGMTAIMKANQGAEPTLDEFMTAVKATRVAHKTWGDEGMTQRWSDVAQGLKPFAQKFMPGVPIPEQYTPEVGKFFEQLDNELSGKKEAGFSLSPGQSRYDDTGKLIVAAPPEAPEAPKTPTLDQALMAAYQGGDQGEVDRLLALKGREAAVTRAPKEAPAPPAERVFNPEGVVLSSYGVREREEVRREARERGIPAFENPSVQAKGVTLAGIVADAEELQSLLAKPEVRDSIGPVAGRWSQLKSKVVDLAPDVQRAIQLMTSLSDTELRKRSGAAINEKEMQRLLRFTTDPNRPLGHNLTAVDGLRKSAGRDYQALSGLFPGQDYGPPPNTAPSEAKRGTGSSKDPYVFE